MRVRFIAVGKAKDRGLQELLRDYYSRIARYAKFDEVEVRDGQAADVAAKITKAVPERARTVALEVDGRALSSRALASWIERAENDAVPSIAFIIGGAYGLPPEISKSADLRLSLSAMTFPHRLARLVLAEQVYRAFSILRGEPYDH